MNAVGLLLLLYSSGVSWYALKTIGKQAFVNGDEDGAGEEEKIPN